MTIHTYAKYNKEIDAKQLDEFSKKKQHDSKDGKVYDEFEILDKMYYALSWWS